VSCEASRRLLEATRLPDDVRAVPGDPNLRLRQADRQDSTDRLQPLRVCDPHLLDEPDRSPALPCLPRDSVGVVAGVDRAYVVPLIHRVLRYVDTRAILGALSDATT
jgi:hypothetical protein